MADGEVHVDFDIKKVYVAVGDDEGTARLFSYDPPSRRVRRTHIMEAPAGAIMQPPQPEQPYHTLGITSISWNTVSNVSDMGEDTNIAHQMRILTSSKDATCKVWYPWSAKGGSNVVSFQDKEKTSDGRRMDVTVGHTNYVNMACWKESGAEAGHQVVSCSDDGTAKIWDGATGELRHTLHAEGLGHQGNVSMARWSADGSKILTCGHDMLCMLWSPKNGHLTKVLPQISSKDPEKNHTGPIWSAEFGPSGHRVVTASKDCSVRTWDCNTGQSIVCFKDPKYKTPTMPHTMSHGEAVFGATWNKHEGGHEVLSFSLDGTAKIWDNRQADKPAIVIDDHKGCVWSASYGNTSGTTILTASHDMSAMIYDKRRQQPKCILARHTGILWQAVLSPDDQYVVTCSDDRSARLWDLQGQDTSQSSDGRPQIRKPPSVLLSDNLSPYRAAVTCAAFAPSDQEVLASV